MATLLTLFVVVGAGIGGAWLALRSEEGTAQALGWVPGLKVVEPHGTLWGDFRARRIELALPNNSRLTLMEPQWRGLRWERSSGSAWGVQLHLDRLQALSADLRWFSAPSQGPSKPPTAVDLPFGVRIDALSVGRFQSNLLGAHPLTDIAGRLALQQPGSKPGRPTHEVVVDALHWQNWSLDGRALMVTRGDMTLDASLTAASQMSPKGQAKVLLRGPLMRMGLSAQVQVAQQAPAKAAPSDTTATAAKTAAKAPAKAASPGQNGKAVVRPPLDAAPQTLSAEADLAPFAPWPLPRAEVRARRFDLQRLWSGLPMTSLTGQLDVVPMALPPEASAPNAAGAKDNVPKGVAKVPASDLLIKVDLANEQPGPWDAGAVPVVSVRASATLPAQADTQHLGSLGLKGRVDANVVLPSQVGRAPGMLRLQGPWDLQQRRQTALLLSLQGVDTQVLHGQAPALLLKGDARVQGQDDDSWLVQARVDGRDAGGRQGQVLREAVQAVLDGRWRPGRFDLAELSLTAGAARAKASGQWSAQEPQQSPKAASASQTPSAPVQETSASWQAKADLQVKDFDPAVWMPWPRPAGDALQRTRLNGQGSVALTMPGRWADLQGKGGFQLADSSLLGVAVSGDVKVDQTASAKGTLLQAKAQLKAGGNDAGVELHWPGGVGLDGQPPVSTGARLLAKVNAPALGGLQGWVQPMGWRGLTGRIQADVQVDSPGPGRWATSGEMSASGVYADLPGGGQAQLDGTRATWRMGLGDAPADAKPWQLDAQLGQARWGQWGLQQFKVLVQGLAAQHQWSWQGRIDLPERKGGNGEPVRESALAQASGQSGWRGNLLAESDRAWHSRVQVFKVQPLVPATGRPWLEAQPFEIDWRKDKAGQRLTATPTRVDVFGAVLALRQLVWDQRGEEQGRSDVLLELEPLKLAEVLARLQPEVGWGGDLLLAGRVKAAHQPGQPWIVEAELARQSGDLSLTEQDIEGTSAQRLGVRQMKLALQARDGVWTATQQMEARVSGSIEGRQVVQVQDRTALPGADDPLTGQIAAQVANLRAIGVWAPPGWRLSGKLSAQAQLSGTLGAPQYEGRIQGQELGATQTLLGVHLTDGTLDLLLKGDHARLESLTARDGEASGGSLRLSGDAVLGAQPTANLQLQVTRFALLQRVDRRVVVSGDLQLGLTEDTLSAQGQARVDEGLVDISQSDAPTIGDDVNVINRPGVSDAEDAAAAAAAASPRRKLQVALAVDLGSKLRLRGRGIDTHLRGALKLATPNGRPAITGTVSTVDGTYAAYGQKLVIERGSIAFTGPVDNPRLDIQAMRPQSPTASASDVKVGVLITGTAQDPRVRLYSEPTMSETEKLSWLVLGRGSSGLGGADIGLLQTAAAALLAGEGGSPTDNVLSTIGLDQLSVRQSDGAVRETIVTVGKQISDKWYVGYERSLNATEGTWQLIYRLAQRFTVRAQSGDDNAVDLIWSLRWN
ncbi:MAG TPA: translocation/assembly module TamB domain-containing protein [Candidatus Aquabacterium excrementipullorum]|nr:translocation/assembly module TamB domain-containing protein [Candidatus Aquabacterium excrementipullorum]